MKPLGRASLIKLESKNISGFIILCFWVLTAMYARTADTAKAFKDPASAFRLETPRVMGRLLFPLSPADILCQTRSIDINIGFCNGDIHRAAANLHMRF